MKWIPVFVFASFCLPLQNKAQNIRNQDTLQTSSNFYISGTGTAKAFKSTAGTSVSGTAHFHMSNGDGNQQANLRWTQVLVGSDDTGNTGSDFSLFRYSNGGNLIGPALTVARASGNTTFYGGITMANPTSNLISFNPVGLSAPTFTTRSPGTRIAIHNSLSPSSGDYGIGVEAQHMWFSLSSRDNTRGFKFYAGIDQIGRIDGFGATD